MNEREYDRIQNEGGEGYSPIRAKREAQDRLDRVAAACEHSLTPQGRIDALHRRISRECGSVARDCSPDPSAIDALASSLYAAISAIESEINAAFLAIWTPDETSRRRDEWNARVKAGEFNLHSGKVDARKAYQAMQIQGWTINDLKKAVKLNNLS